MSTFSGAVVSNLDYSRRREKKDLRHMLNSIAITLGLETWDDLPAGKAEQVLEAVEKALNAKTLAAYLRGLRARDAADGKDPDALPQTTRQGVTAALERIIRETERTGIDYGFPKVADEAREALRLLDAETLQTGEPRSEAIGKLRCSLCNKGLATVSMYIQSKDSIHAACDECSTEGMSERERVIREQCEGASHTSTLGYLLGVIDVIREDRNRLRKSFNEEPLTREKIRDAVRHAYHSCEGNIVDDVTNAVCELLSSKGARVLQSGVR